MKTSYRYCATCKCLHDVANWPHQEEIAVEAKYDPSATYDEYLNGPKSGTFMRCKICGDMHDVYNWPGNHMPEQYDLQSELGAPYFISDNLESLGGLNGIQSMADGKFYTSKAKLRAEYRARGLTEMGNSKPAPFKKPKPDRKAIRDAVKRATWQVEHEGATAQNYRQRAKRADTAFGPVAKAAAK
jgi:hypothetical protein